MLLWLPVWLMHSANIESEQYLCLTCIGRALQGFTSGHIWKAILSRRDTVCYKRSTKSFCGYLFFFTIKSRVYFPLTFGISMGSTEIILIPVYLPSFSSVTLLSSKPGCPSHTGNSESYQNSSILNYLLSYSNFLLISMDFGSCLSAQPIYPLFPPI